MSPERARALSELLREMRELDGGYFPDVAWLEIQRTFAIPYVEVVIPRPGPAGGFEFLLTQRDGDDEYFPGRPWHIPGGIWRTSVTRERACADVARRELGIPVAFACEVLTYKWLDHPYANPISHVCVCTPEAGVEIQGPGRFFALSDLPTPLLPHHAEFLDACHARLLANSR